MDTQASQLFEQGNLHLASGDRDGAEACFRHAVSIAPDMAEAHANLGWVMAEKGMTAEAQEFYRQALVRSASHIGIRLNYGAFLARLKRFDAAERVYLGAIDRDFDNPQVWSNLGALYAQMERFAEAEACCGIALALDENYAKAHVNLAYLCLRRGEFEEGWEHYEWRGWKATLFAEACCRHWRGESLVGRSIVIGHEAGFGDAIQFCRYAAALRARGASHVTLVCPAPLQVLFTTLQGVDEVLDRAALPAQPRWDFRVSLMSLPRLLGTRLDSIPASLPYLFAPPADVRRWRPLISPETGRRARVGLAWRGNPDFENDSDRSLHSPELLAELLSVPEVEFVILQKEVTAGEAASMRSMTNVHHVMDGVESFADTAAIVAGLDLVVCVDTAIAHLAGALGKECWLLLPRHMTDWRWLGDRDDSPWYPNTMRLFKQPRIGDWSSVVASVKGELARAAARLVGSRA